VTSESRDGQTPNGGVRSTIFYEDESGSPADKSAATKCVIVEYDAQGNSINRIYGTMKLSPKEA